MFNKAKRKERRPLSQEAINVGSEEWLVQDVEPVIHTDNEQLGVSQGLLGVIGMGGTLASIVAVKNSTTDDESSERFFITHVPEGSDRAEVLTEINSYQPTTLGRGHQARLDKMVSGDHCQIRLDSRQGHKKLYIRDLSSTNGTSIRFNDQLTNSIAQLGFDDFRRWAPRSGTFRENSALEKPQIVERAPRLGAIALLSEKEHADESTDKARQIRLNDLEQQMAELTESLLAINDNAKDEETGLLMWEYGAGMANKKDAQERGDGAGSILHEQNAMKAFNKLTRDEQKMAQEYRKVMGKKNSVFRQIRAIEQKEIG